jgi:ferrous iron transport protein A
MQSLNALPVRRPGVVRAVVAPAAQAEWGQFLLDLGFIVGERVTVLRRAFPGGDPLVVRVGLSTYALRRAEAACVLVEPAA